MLPYFNEMCDENRDELFMPPGFESLFGVYVTAVNILARGLGSEWRLAHERLHTSAGVTPVLRMYSAGGFAQRQPFDARLVDEEFLEAFDWAEDLDITQVLMADYNALHNLLKEAVDE